MAEPERSPLRILIVDDQPMHFKPYVAALNKDGHVTHWARDLTQGWAAIEYANAHPLGQYSLVLIDMLLERREPAFATEQLAIDTALGRRNKASFPSGQCLGLRLWHQRETLNLGYTYVTNHLELWIPQLAHPGEPSDLEFCGAIASRSPLITSKTDWANDSCFEKIREAMATWQEFTQ